MSFVSSTNRFFRSAKWLTDEDAPAKEAMKAAAKSLDTELNPALLGQYRLIYSALLKKAPVENVTTDPLEALLDEATD